MNDNLYDQIPETPADISATNSIARMVDGLGFRYRWATEGLTDKEVNFRPVESSMDMLQLIGHIYDLAIMSSKTFGRRNFDKKPGTFEELRTETLLLLLDLSERLKAMPDSDLDDSNYRSLKIGKKYPFWYMINGPIADALTHVGQITSWRRIAGNPQPKGVNVFAGKSKIY